MDEIPRRFEGTYQIAVEKEEEAGMVREWLGKE